MALTAKQKTFVAEYLVDLNATRAAKEAGYSEKTAFVQGSRMLRNVKVRKAVEEGQKKKLAKLEISAEAVLNEIKLLAFARMNKYVRVLASGMAEIDLSELQDDDWAAVQEFTVDQTGGGAGDGERKAVERVRFKLADKGLNLERLGRHLKLFVDRVEVSGLDELAERMARGRKAAEENVSEA